MFMVCGKRLATEEEFRNTGRLRRDAVRKHKGHLELNWAKDLKD